MTELARSNGEYQTNTSSPKPDTGRVVELSRRHYLVANGLTEHQPISSASTDRSEEYLMRILEGQEG